MLLNLLGTLQMMLNLLGTLQMLLNLLGTLQMLLNLLGTLIDQSKVSCARVRMRQFAHEHSILYICKLKVKQEEITMHGPIHVCYT